MAIPASQLETWSRQGATVAAQATYTSVKAALDADSSPVKTVNKEIFLQGSYRNSTNIHGESDVDIVVKLNGVYTSNTVGLNAYEKAVFARDFRTASYGWQEFRRDVLQALRITTGQARSWKATSA